MSMGFSRQESWNVLPCSPLGDLSDPGTELSSPVAPALQADSLPLSHWGSPIFLSFLFAGFILILQIELLKRFISDFVLGSPGTLFIHLVVFLINKANVKLGVVNVFRALRG